MCISHGFGIGCVAPVLQSIQACKPGLQATSDLTGSRINISERPVDALALKKWITDWVTTWNQEMLAHLKIDLLKQYGCWTDKMIKFYEKGTKKQKITIRVSFLSRASLNLCPGLLQSLQPHKSDKNKRSFKYIFAFKIHFVYSQFFSVFANCLASVYTHTCILWFCIVCHKKRITYFCSKYHCAQRSHISIFLCILFSEIPLNLSPQLGCECWIWD